VAAAGTYPAHIFPIRWAAQVCQPKGPASALLWPGRIDLASPCLGVQKDTVTVGPLHEAPSVSHGPKITGLELFDRHIQMLGQAVDFFGTHPNKARSSTTTPATAGTLKSESLMEPRKATLLPYHLIKTSVPFSRTRPMRLQRDFILRFGT